MDTQNTRQSAGYSRHITHVIFFFISSEFGQLTPSHTFFSEKQYSQF